MALSKNEQLLLEEMKSLLSGNIQLGLGAHKTSDESHSAQYFRENIDQQFRLEIADLVHHDSISAAFKKVHDFKQINDPTFMIAFQRALTSFTVPIEESRKAMKAADKIIADLDKKNTTEATEGWHPQLDEVMATANPE